jgi:hypothetical protein
MRAPKPSEKVIIALFVVVLICILWGWWLSRCWRRSLDVKVHEMENRKESA